MANNIIFGKRKKPLGGTRLAPISPATTAIDAPVAPASIPPQTLAPAAVVAVAQPTLAAQNQPINTRTQPTTGLPAARNKPLYEGQESRVASRKKMLKGCKIIFNNRSSIFDGVIVNLSETGAKLKVANARYVANEFTLCAVQGDFERICSVQWRKNDFIGVHFEEL
ncbi:MAG: hypothetical protein HRU29_02735 [Rhizobiales bacterium]|nr:hypothetical protein [Hyphomicrobiales bacterium]NRB13295.1 hypothetical protein [Hyphomicrobiales bacterium]